jgi:hypothetical protein
MIVCRSVSRSLPCKRVASCGIIHKDCTSGVVAELAEAIQYIAEGGSNGACWSESSPRQRLQRTRSGAAAGLRQRGNNDAIKTNCTHAMLNGALR